MNFLAILFTLSCFALPGWAQMSQRNLAYDEIFTPDNGEILMVSPQFDPETGQEVSRLRIGRFHFIGREYYFFDLCSVEELICTAVGNQWSYPRESLQMERIKENIKTFAVAGALYFGTVPTTFVMVMGKTVGIRLVARTIAQGTLMMGLLETIECANLAPSGPYWQADFIADILDDELHPSGWSLFTPWPEESFSRVYCEVTDILSDID